MVCPLCRGDHVLLFETLHGSDYFQCQTCALIFLDPSMRLEPCEEKQKYDLHQNDPQDEGYRNFLQPAVDAVVQNVPQGANGLDYGCGPGPTVSVMLQEQGMTCADFDPIYQNQLSLLEQTYDFVTCTETAEHFHDPMDEFKRLQSLLKTGGVLVIMTLLFDVASQFAGSHYHRDPTHVCFFSTATFQWVALKLQMAVSFPHPRVIVMKSLLS